MVVRHNYLTRFQTGIRVAEVTNPGSYNTIAAASSESYLAPLREGPLWLVADNVLEASRIPVNAPSCMQIDNTRV
jgi:hypothetical protein